jgi:hypothetical protein
MNTLFSPFYIPNEVNVLISDVFSAMKTSITTTLFKQIKVEKIRGIAEEDAIKAADLLFIVVFFVYCYNEITSPFKTKGDVSYYYELFKIEEIAECLACKDIDLIAIWKASGIEDIITSTPTVRQTNYCNC